MKLADIEHLHREVISKRVTCLFMASPNQRSRVARSW